MQAEQVRALADRFIESLSRLERNGLSALDELPVETPASSSRRTPISRTRRWR